MRNARWQPLQGSDQIRQGIKEAALYLGMKEDVNVRTHFFCNHWSGETSFGLRAL